MTSATTANLRVASIEDERIEDEELVMAIGKYNDLGLRGLHGLEAYEWYRNVITDDLDVPADDLLKYAFPKLIKQNSGRLPLNKYLSEAVGEYVSVKQIWDEKKNSIEKATHLIAHLPEEKIDIDELGDVLYQIFEEDVNVLQSSKQGIRTNVRRLISIYDYLKWGK